MAIIETIEGYTPEEVLWNIFHIKKDCFGDEQWVLDSPIFEKKPDVPMVRIKITIETIE